MKKLLFFLITLIIAGCQPSAQTIQTAIAKTQSAIAKTQSAEPTQTLSPATATSTQIPTATQTSTPIPTATFIPTATPDTRVIIESPRTFLLTQKDFPPEGKYYLPNSAWIQQDSNDMIISAWGVEKGRAYVIATGREYDWNVDYKRGTLAVQMPDEVFCDVVAYKTTEGAQLSLTKYNDVERSPLSNGAVYHYVDSKMDIGDKSIAYVYHKIDSGGQTNTEYVVEFTFRNILAIVDSWDYKEENVPPPFVEQLAKVVLEKLRAAPLVDPQDAVFEK